MKIVFRFLLISILGCVSMAQAETAMHTAVDTEHLLAQYTRSWSLEDSTQRLAILETIWTDDGVHESPYGRSDGIAAINQEIEGFLKMFPGATVTLADIKQTGNHIVCTFVLKNPDGGVVMTGTDYFEFNEAGRLLKVVGFVAKK
jgi:hypothetical protein